MSDIETNLNAVRRRIEAARERSPYHQVVTLVAVTKFHPRAAMEEAVRCGVADVGENRVQEMEEKFRMGPLPVRWHLQGHLQKNKVKKAVAIADLIHSGDSLDILKEIGRRAGEIGKRQDVLLEFNISGEESKHGLDPKDFDAIAAAAGAVEGIRVTGLMCMAPNEEPELTRPVFREGRALWERLKSKFPEGQISVLSMGMTNDFEVAVEEGATMVRIGTAIFGPRDYNR